MAHKITRLRKIQKSDSRYFLKWWKDKELIKLTSGIYEKDDNVLKGYFLAMLNSKKDSHYLIHYDSKIVGNISLSYKDKKTFEIHIVIGEKDYWGKGIGGVSINKVLNIAFKKLDYNKAYIEVRPENKRAIELYEFCGFIKLGVKKYPDNKYQPEVLKMILDKESFLKRASGVS